MKIAMISSSVLRTPPAGYGGLERVVWDLTVELCKQGHKVVLFATKGSSVPPKGFLYETVESTEKVEQDWTALEEQSYKVYKPTLTDFDIVHDHSWWGHVYLAKAERPEIKVCHTHHGHLHQAWTRPVPVQYVNMIGISRYMATEYASLMRRDVHWVYNGLDTEMYVYSQDHGERLLYVGRFTPYKGAHIALEVAKKVEMPLDLVGGSFVEDPAYMETIKKQCDGDKYRMFVDAPHETKIKLMQQARCLLFPSQMGEPFGLVGMEANACGCPVVALADGAIPEIVINGLNGYVCQDPDQMAAMVRTVDQIKPKACRTLVEENFSSKVMAARYLRQYEAILKGDEW